MTKQEAYYCWIDVVFETCGTYLTNDGNRTIFACEQCPHKDERATLDCWKYLLADKCVEVMNSINEADKKRKKAK